ncbi:MAG: ABC transporter permease [Acidobacteria bacterium]|nr:ABC transporter permease [Acidobacteriota bacterium]
MELAEFLLENRAEVTRLIGQHVSLVLLSTVLACAVGIPAGLVMTRSHWFEKAGLGFANVVQTIPSLALFGFLIPVPAIGGIGARTAIVAMVLYALLPIVRNTYAGIRGVEESVLEAGRGLGLTPSQLMWHIQIPLSLDVIMAGVRVAAITSVGVATIAAAIGAGGLGMYIFRGVASVNSTLILAGAVPAALMALMVDFALGRLEVHLRRHKRS